MRTNWRDCQAWASYGTPMSTTNNEAAKLYDGLLTQYVGWYDDPSLGGMEKTISDMMTADPEIVMGHVIKNGLECLGTGRNIRLDAELRKDVDVMVSLANKNNATARERKHAGAVKLWADGEMTAACKEWESILVEHPRDMLALKFAHDSYFYLGYHPQMRDSIARVMPHWDKSLPLFGYLYGMHAIGLEECNQYEQAEKIARKGLDFNRNDAWATHSMAHVLEMGGRADEGIEFMSSTENDWNICGMIACHNYWHYGVYNIEKGYHEAALGLYDAEVGRRALASGAMLDLVDACSLLYRLKLEGKGQEVRSRWNEILEVCKPHVDDHVLTFNDAHFLMASLGAEDKETTDKLISSMKDFAKDDVFPTTMFNDAHFLMASLGAEDKATTDKLVSSMKDFAKNGCGDNQRISAEVGVPLCEGIVAYENGEYAKAVDLVEPVRYRIITIGGSHAQRDVFNQFLIHAALNSPETKHQRLARFLLTERKTLKNNAPLTDRLMARAMAIHCG